MAGISVDTPTDNAAMVEKLRLPFPLLSDPEGALIQRYGLWDGESKIAVPAILVLDRSGVVQYLYEGHDFADRPGDAEVFDALRDSSAGGEYAGTAPEIRVSADQADHSVGPDRPAMSLPNLVIYYRGAYFASVALKGRAASLGAEGREATRMIGRYQQTVQEFSKALQETVTRGA